MSYTKTYFYILGNLINFSDNVYMEIKEMEKSLVKYFPKRSFAKKLENNMQMYVDAHEKANKMTVKYVLTKFAFR